MNWLEGLSLVVLLVLVSIYFERRFSDLQRDIAHAQNQLETVMARLGAIEHLAPHVTLAIRDRAEQANKTADRGGQ